MATDAAEQGRLAFRNNHPMSSCQYPVGSSLRTEWMEGWTSARNADPHPSDGTGSPEPHPGMMGDGTEEQNLNQPGHPENRIRKDEVDAAFGEKSDGSS